MFGYFSAIPMLLLLAFACSASPNESLRAQLLAMAQADQAARSIDHFEDADNANATIEKLNVEHAERMKILVQEHGWPTRRLVGDEGEQAAWLLVQHSDHDPDFQRSVLRLMEPLLGTEEASTQNYAYLWDRTHSPQRFGTQGDCIAKGNWVPREIELIADVNKRRAEAGLFPPRLEDYIQMGNSLCR